MLDLPTHTRRTFLQASLTAAFSAPLTTALGHDGAGETAPLFVDTHTHFYDPTRPGGVPWPGPGDKVLSRPILPAEFRTLTKPHGRFGTIVVEASPLLEDNQWLLDLAEKNAPTILGVVGNLDPLHPDFPKHVARFRKQPRYLGFRLGQQALHEGLAEPRFLERLKLVADAGWALDLNGGPDLLADVAQLAQQMSSLRIVINHLANVRIDGQAPPHVWAENLARCAAHKNVWCKMSALVEGARLPDDTAPQELAYYRPVLDAAWNAFGEDRLIYGSNWPVSAKYAPYAQVFRLAQEYIAGKGPAAVEKFFLKNAQAAYQWPAL